MTLRHLLFACAAMVALAGCSKRDASLASSAPVSTPAADNMAAAPAAATPAAPAAGEPAKDKSWAGQVNEAKAVASAQGNAAQDRAEKADGAAK
jgi:hypothetical protein